MSDDLTLNKILGACLVTGLVIMGVRIGSDAIYGQKVPSKPGYAIEVADTGEAGAAAVVDTPPDWGTVLASANVDAGSKTFVKCQACHNNTQGGPNQTGPNLFGVVGRPTASHPGFDYSDGMKDHAKDSPNWTYDQLYMFLGGPQKWVKGTKMTFVGIKKPQDRIDLIAYLRSQGSTGYAIPAPDPKRAAGAAAAGSASTSAAPGAPATAGAAVSASSAAADSTAPGNKTPAPKAATSASAVSH